ncbi:MAG: phosphoglucosamine mutase, partial [Thermoleophilia bacterium]|nr:phosphoglucosamine mutase [Thermoleophilia bacterium]
MARELFGTDGIRGVANRELTCELALAMGRAATLWVGPHSRNVKHPRVIIGRDTRRSGSMLEAAFAAGVSSVGGEPVFLGIVPTPAVALTVELERADLGVVISASHNPFDDNGLKVFGRDGFKLPDEVELELEALMERGGAPVLARGAALGRARRVEDAVGRYVTHLKSLLDKKYDLDGMKIVVDCANGAAYKAAPTLLRELGAEVIALGDAPNGLNINRDCGSLHPELAARTVVATGADLGIALDGDADRLILIDERGNVVDGDAVLALCALHMKNEGELANDTVVATVMSNMGLERALHHDGVKVERTQVGDRYVVQRMREGGFNFGGEQS